MQDTSELFRQIEQRYGFALPDEYRRMHERGWFGPVPPGVGRDIYLYPQRHAYLWLGDMEWMPLADILNFEFLSFIKPPVPLIPFAHTAGGDHWCWSPQHATGTVVPVVACPRDDCTAKVYARDFVSALYRQILDFAHFMLDEVKVARRQLGRWEDDLGPYFGPEWRKTVADLRDGPVKSRPLGKTKLRSLLLPEEHAAIIKRDLTFPRLNERFNWMGI